MTMNSVKVWYHLTLNGQRQGFSFLFRQSMRSEAALMRILEIEEYAVKSLAMRTMEYY